VDEQEVGVQQALVVWPRWMQLVRMGPYLAVTTKMMKTVLVLLMCWLWLFWLFLVVLTAGVAGRAGVFLVVGTSLAWTGGT